MTSHPLINIATQAAVNASKIIMRNFSRLNQSDIKAKSKNNFVTKVDIASEKEIIHTIKKAFPDHAILSEEGTQDNNLQSNHEYLWIIDPLDGTTNYIHGHPHFSISIAVKYKGKLEHALVYDPISDELFTATNGGGAYLNNRRIRVNKKHIQLTGALLATGHKYNNEKNLQKHLQLLETLLPETAGIRRTGSSALDLAYVAAGRLNGFWNSRLFPWDIAAGALLVKEAGGFVNDFSEKNKYLENGQVIAGNEKIFKLLLKKIQNIY